MPSKTFERYDVVVVPFPFTDKTSTKRRPAVILSGAAGFNQQAQHAVMAMITTATEHPWPLDTPIADLSSAGLNVPCTLRFKLFTLDVRLIVRQAGSLGRKYRAAVAKSLRMLILES